MTTEGRPRRLPDLRLREFGPGDEALRGQLSLPETAGEWDSFDDPPAQMLSGPTYGGRLLVRMTSCWVARVIAT
jgi:hypothetical protein